MLLALSFSQSQLLPSLKNIWILLLLRLQYWLLNKREQIEIHVEYANLI